MRGERQEVCGSWVVEVGVLSLTNVCVAVFVRNVPRRAECGGSRSRVLGLPHAFGPMAISRFTLQAGFRVRFWVNGLPRRLQGVTQGQFVPNR